MITDKYGNKIVYEYRNGVYVATIIEQTCKETETMTECVLESFDDFKKQVIQYRREHLSREYEVDFLETSAIDYPAFSVPIISGDLVVTFLFEESFSVAKKFVYRVGSCTSDGCVYLIGTIHKELRETRPHDKRINVV